MRKINILQSVLSFGVIVLLGSCTSMQIKESQLVSGKNESVVSSFLSGDPSAGNTLVYRNTALTLPEKWSFLLPHRSENEMVIDQPGEVVYRFVHPSEELSGVCVVFASDEVDARVPRIAQFYAKVLPEDYQIYTKVQSRVQQGTATIIHGGTKESGVSFISLLLEYEGSTYVIEVTGPDRVVLAQAESLSSLLHSFAVIDKAGFSMRNSPHNRLQFHSYAGQWQWFEDLPKGVSFYTTMDNKKIVAAIDRSLSENSQFQDMYLFSRAQEYSGRLLINNRPTDVVLYAGMISRTSGRVACEAKVNGIAYRIDIQVYGVKNIDELMAVYKSDHVQQLFANNVVFN